MMGHRLLYRTDGPHLRNLPPLSRDLQRSHNKSAKPPLKEAQRLFIFTAHFICSFAHSQASVACQVWACCGSTVCLQGPPSDTPEYRGGAAHSPSTVFFILLRACSLAEWGREQLAQAPRLAIKPM